MTTSIFPNSVAIDTNIFQQLLNPAFNIDDHIGQFLRALQDQETRIICDDLGKIFGEYESTLTPIIRNRSETDSAIYVLRYWVEIAPKATEKVNLRDQLMTRIRQVIKERSESVDQILVYVALKGGKPLITNDHIHIVDGPPRETKQGKRSHRLLKGTKRLRPPGAEILTSLEARGRLGAGNTLSEGA